MALGVIGRLDNESECRFNVISFGKTFFELNGIEQPIIQHLLELMLISRLILEWVAKSCPNIVLYLQTVGVFRAGFSYDDLVVYATTVDGFTAV